ncbi:hypothetical protein EJB05_36972, partial [Eragrostis curvula]
MLPWRNGKKAPVPTGRDGIDALPDGVLEHILGGRADVRACKALRHLWKSVTALHIMCVGRCGEEEPTFLVERQKFVDNMFHVRGLAPLERYELRIGDLYQEDDITSVVHSMKHVVLCQVQMLRVDNVYHDGFELNDLSLVSSRLMRLELIGISLNNDLCDLSGCPSLEYLEFSYCNFWCTTRISSVSLKYLRITSCGFRKAFHTLIFTPSLVSLRLDDHWCRTPFFEIIPSLHDAFVRVTCECFDCCMDDHSGFCPVENCFFCDAIKHDSSKCLNLDGLSESENLAWIVESKTGHKHKFGMKGVCNSMDISAALSEHLKIVEVKSVVIDECILNVLKFLSTLNFRFSLDEVEILED